MFIRIKIKDGAILPCCAKKGDWLDLYTSEDVELKQGEYKEIPLGIAMELPTGYEAIIAPRSSTFKRYGCIEANSIGVIDEAYNGDEDYWCFPVYATKNITIPKGTRLCQFRIIEHQPDFVFLLEESLGNNNRGGLGSTGT